jgi:hypothetical protein
MILIESTYEIELQILLQHMLAHTTLISMPMSIIDSNLITPKT